MTNATFEIKEVIKVLEDNTVITVKYLVCPNAEPRFLSGTYIRIPRTSTSFLTH